MRAALLLPLLLAGLLGTAAPAAAQVDACTDTANVNWVTNWRDVTVETAIVHVPGCEDGEEVGLQLLTDDGDLPSDPLVEPVQAEHATFDLTPLDVRIEPVTGVRVLLQGEELIEVVDIVVEQRFFASSGNEQRGLLRTTTLEVPLDGEYEVPGAPTRYDIAPCAAVQWVAPDDLIGEGAGTFTATTAGTHVVCYQQQPGSPGGQPDPEDPTVVGTEVLGTQFTRPSPESDTSDGAAGGPLPRTGANVLALALTGLTLIVVGRRATRPRGD